MLNSQNPRWTGPEAAQLAGVTYDTLNYWVKSGLVKSSVLRSTTHRRIYFTFSDIVTIATIKTLRDSGFSLQKIKKASDELWKRVGIRFEQGLQGGVIVADHNQILAVLYTFDEAVEIMSLLKGGQMVLPLSSIVNEIKERVNESFGETDQNVQQELLGKVRSG